MGSKRSRVRALILLFYAVAAFEVVLAARAAAAGAAPVALACVIVAVGSGLLTRALWRDFERRGEDDWRYSWRALYRRLRD
jgi:hypothetical protein